MIRPIYHLYSKVLGSLPHQPNLQIIVIRILVFRIQLAHGWLGSHNREKGMQQGRHEAVLQQGLRGGPPLSISPEQAQGKLPSSQPQGAQPELPILLGRNRRWGQDLSRTKITNTTNGGDSRMGQHPYLQQEGTYLAFDFDQESEAAENTHTKCFAQGHILSHLYRH